jgi:vancomycin resistance protein VanW
MESVKRHVEEHLRPKRRALSSRFPVLAAPAVFARRLVRSLKNRATLPKLARRVDYLGYVVARHSSPLRRRLGESDPELNEGKIANLRVAIRALDGLVIPPGKTFSFWKAVGGVSTKRGYVEGMLLSNGKVVRGLGGGLCQLSNFLAWIFLHADTRLTERHHHSVDAFPDSGRTIPFGSGATVFSNYLDLQAKNVSDRQLQLKLWLTDGYLKGQLLSDAPAARKYHVFQKKHLFAERGGKFFRYNEIHRETFVCGEKVAEELVFTNFAPVAYQTTREALQAEGHEVREV